MQQIHAGPWPWLAAHFTSAVGAEHVTILGRKSTAKSDGDTVPRVKVPEFSVKR